MHISKNYEASLPRKFRRKRPLAIAMAWGTPKTISIDGEDFTLQNQYQDNFLSGVKKAIKKIGNKFKKKADEIKKIPEKTNHPAAQVFSKGAGFAAQSLGDITTDVTAPIGDLVEKGAAAGLILGTAAVAAPTSLLATKLAAINAKGLTAIVGSKGVKNILNDKSKETLITKGKELAKDQLKKQIGNLLDSGTRNLINNDPTNPALLPKTRDTKQLEEIVRNEPQVLQAGTPLSFNNPVLITAIIGVFLLLAMLFRGSN